MIQNQPITVNHITDKYTAYPGETVTLKTRVEIHTTVKGYQMQVMVPAIMDLQDYRVPGSHPDPVPNVAVVDRGSLIVWKTAKTLQAGTTHEYQVQATVKPLQLQTTTTSRAVASYETGEGNEQFASEIVRITLNPKSQYIHYLPALYENDDFMGRFLMLFESFWKPIEDQVRQISYYFDPRMTPAEMLPWLASWVDLVLDERWSEARRRELLNAAVKLYRKRGTLRGLQEYLEIYTGQIPQIVEHRAHNLRLSPDARLGPGIALGQANKPHTFTVNLSVPAIQAENPEEKRLLATDRQRRIEAIIEAEKPAHTSYTLNIVESNP